MSAHTPGPWRAVDTPDGIRIDGDGGNMAERIAWRPNASLIAAAPEMLTCLESLADRFVRCVVHSGSAPEMAAEAVKDARTVIAKARGVEPTERAANEARERVLAETEAAP